MSVLPFDVPDDLGADVQLVAVEVPHVFVCEQPIENSDYWRRSGPHPCTTAATFRMVATDRTDDGYWVSGSPPPVPFTIGERRNVCGTHRRFLERRGWSLDEELPARLPSR